MLRCDGFRAWGCTFTYVLYDLDFAEYPCENVDFAQFVRYCKYKEEKQGRRRELTMWKKHKHLFLFPAAVLGILAVCWMSGRVSEFNKWYLIIAGTVGLYCWVSELVEFLRERKKEKEEP